MAAQADIGLVLGALCKDDARAFEMLVRGDAGLLRLCFGRFPLLSLAYLYRAHRIAKICEGRIKECIGDLITAEPNQAYKLFCKAAGVNLIKYISKEVVTPPEMLAIIKRTRYLKSRWKLFNPGVKEQAIIMSVYKRRGRPAVIQDGALSVPNEPLSKRAVAIAMIIVLAVIVLGSSAGGATALARNIASRPIDIDSAAQLAAHAGRDRELNLRGDITVSNTETISILNARLNGNNHTVTVSGSNPLIKYNRGSVRNLNIAVVGGAISVAEDYGILAAVNYGAIDNVTVTSDIQIDVSSEREAVNVGAVTARNTGTVSNATVSGNISVTISGGISGAVAAIAAYNEGHITNSINRADISLRVLGAGGATEALIGGIAGNNRGRIDRALNYGGIAVYTGAGWADAGGIAAALIYGGEITNSGSFGQIVGEVAVGATGFLGGIVGWGVEGAMRNNFSLSIIEADGIGERVAVGGVFGCLFGTLGHFGIWHFLVTAANNLFVPRAPYIEYGIGIRFVSNPPALQYRFLSGMDIAPYGTVPMGEQELRNHPIFWTAN